ncbi:MAG: hypothetical protein ACI9JN_000491 [Bacteroidia bacterium]|jgi:hypothetical protein
MKLLAIVFVFMILPTISFSQMVVERTTVSQSLRLGYNIAPNISNIRAGSMLPDNASLFNGLGYRVGFRADYSFNKTISISPEIDWSFNGGGFTFSDSSQEDYLIMPASIDFMVHVIIKKQRENVSPYFLLGPNFKAPIFHKNKSTIFETTTDLAVNFGVGFEKRFPFFAFSPELRYSIGLWNINTHPSFQSVNLHNVSLALNFSRL